MTLKNHPSFLRACLITGYTQPHRVMLTMRSRIPRRAPLTGLTQLTSRMTMTTRLRQITDELHLAGVTIDEASGKYWSLPQGVREQFTEAARLDSALRPYPKPRKSIRPLLTQDERDARRAKADPRFRRTFLAALTRREKAIRAYPLTLDGVTHYVESAAQRSTALDGIRALRAACGCKTETPALAPVTGAVRVPVSESAVRKVKAPLNMRGEDATLRPDYRTHGDHSAGKTLWKNGKPVSYTRATHDNYVRSFAIITGPLSVEYALHDRELTLTLPAESDSRWDVDTHGLRVVHGANDYHVSADDMLAGVASILAALERYAMRRAEMRARAVAEAASLEGVFVCLADSLRAGNCKEGSLSFAARHSLNTRRHYAPLELLQVANGDASRVRLAITAARLRTERENTRGYAVLAEHMVA